jgi:tetratricopeptide (TPR) repeat protein
MVNNEIEALIQSAKAHYNASDYDEAIADYTKAIDIAPGNMKAEIYLERGRSHKAKGDSDHMEEFNLAVIDYHQAFNLGPKNEEFVRAVGGCYWATFNQRSSAYLKKKDYTHAIEDLQMSIEASKVLPSPLSRLMAESLLADAYRARDLGADRGLNEKEAREWQQLHK